VWLKILPNIRCEYATFFLHLLENFSVFLRPVLNVKLLHVQGEQPHCGFPEKNFSDNAEKLARKVEFYKQCLMLK
jgi:hypothetical protein